MGATTQNWIGRSQYPDPYLDGRVDDFRIYMRSSRIAMMLLSNGQTVLPMAWHKFNETAGTTDSV